MDVSYVVTDPTYRDKTLKCSVCGKHRLDKNNIVDTSFFRSSTDRRIYFCSKTCYRKITPRQDCSDRALCADIF